MKKVADGIYENELLLIRDSFMAWSWQVAKEDDDDLPALELWNPTPPHQGVTILRYTLTGKQAQWVNDQLEAENGRLRRWVDATRARLATTTTRTPAHSLPSRELPSDPPRDNMHGRRWSSDEDGDGPAMSKALFFEAWPVISQWIRED